MPVRNISHTTLGRMDQKHFMIRLLRLSVIINMLRVLRKKRSLIGIQMLKERKRWKRRKENRLRMERRKKIRLRMKRRHKIQGTNLSTKKTK